MLFNELHHCVYRYRDINDGIVKYIGIVDDGTLPTRHKQHRKEEWYKNGHFICEYIQLNNKSETEAMESHLISYYNTDKFYNRSKAGWGLNSMIPTPNESEWKIVPDDTFEFVIGEQRDFLRFQLEKGRIKQTEFNARMNDLDLIVHAMRIERFLFAERSIGGENGK